MYVTEYVCCKIVHKLSPSRRQHVPQGGNKKEEVNLTQAIFNQLLCCKTPLQQRCSSFSEPTYYVLQASALQERSESEAKEAEAKEEVKTEEDDEEYDPESDPFDGDDEDKSEAHKVLASQVSIATSNISIRQEEVICFSKHKWKFSMLPRVTLAVLGAVQHVACRLEGALIAFLH